MVISGRTGVHAIKIQYSPYNSPFVPFQGRGIHWLGAEVRHLPHNAHVHAYDRYKFDQNMIAKFKELKILVKTLGYLDDLASDGVKAAAKRAKIIRNSISPFKNHLISKYFKDS